MNYGLHVLRRGLEELRIDGVVPEKITVEPLLEAYLIRELSRGAPHPLRGHLTELFGVSVVTDEHLKSDVEGHLRLEVAGHRPGSEIEEGVIGSIALDMLDDDV